MAECADFMAPKTIFRERDGPELELTFPHISAAGATSEPRSPSFDGSTSCRTREHGLCCKPPHRADAPTGKENAVKVGFIGLGQMGAGMAANLVKGGHDVVVYNRSPHKAAPLVALGARSARVGDACRGDAVITMLADGHAVEGVAFGDGGIVSILPKGAVHVSSSTIGVATSERLARAHAAAGQRYVAAPVFGRPEAAVAAKLIVLAAGEPDAVASVTPLLDAIGQRTFVMSRQPEAANLVKLSGNFLIASVIESLGEAMALVGKGGVDLRACLDLLTSTLFSAPVYRIYGAR
jgi:3-hydroxyisobutyrate dehydrogenase-like beta-hydroxyacid dehydrogenase